MAAEDYHVYRHHCTFIPSDKLDVWKAVNAKDLPTIQIDQSDGVSASVNYRAEDAVALAAAILEAAGIDPPTAFASAP